MTLQLTSESADNLLVLTELHDRLLAIKPEQASHDAESCEFCNGTFVEPEHANDVSTGGLMKTYSEDEYNTLLAQVADLEAKVNELESVRQESAMEAKIAEVTTQFEAQVSDLQTQLDTATLEVQAAKDERDGVIAYFEALQAEADQAAAAAAVRDERVARVKEVASFPDDHVAARADAWAALDEEAFEALLADWKAIASKGEGTQVPVATAMQASRDTNQAQGGSLREVMHLRFEGVDTRSV